VEHTGDDGVDAVRLKRIEDRPYLLTPNREPDDPDEEYVLTGRSYLDARNFKAVK
jgi:hypothetical protein